jgi:phosphoribosylanthranilate isomerase
MSVWIKICGNTSLADAELAVQAGADAVGFVFAPSPRRVTVQQAAGIVSQLPSAIEKIGVFVDAGLEEIASTARAAGLTEVQLHFSAGPELTGGLRAQLGGSARILRVLHFEAGAGELILSQLAECAADKNVDGVLVDSRTAAAVGGTGVAFNWADARRTIFGDSAAHVRLIAAGGLTPDNVAEAIATLRPWGVDVVSGVEAAPGRKDPLKVHAFVKRARTAAEAWNSAACIED